VEVIITERRLIPIVTKSYGARGAAEYMDLLQVLYFAI
jgi:hypothetical protein